MANKFDIFLICWQIFRCIVIGTVRSILETTAHIHILFYILEMFDYLIFPHFFNGRILISNNKGIMEKNEANRKCAHPDIFFLWMIS